MSRIIIIILIITGIELLGHLLFWIFSRWNEKTVRLTFKSIFKGLLERTFITFTLLSDLPHALTFFAALKIATRIKEEDNISNEYYLVGNILSVSMAIIYFNLLSDFF